MTKNTKIWNPLLTMLTISLMLTISDGIRGLVHIQDLCVWIHELLQLVDIHRVLQRTILRLPRRRWRAEKRIFQAEGWHLWSGRLPQRTLHPAFNHHDWQAVREQFHGVLLPVSPPSQRQTLHNWVNSATFCCSAFYNWWRQRKHKRETKDETHLHMVSYSTTLANFSSFK